MAFFSVRMFVAVVVFAVFIMAMVMTVFVRLRAVLVGVTVAAFIFVLVAAVVGMPVPGVTVTFMRVLMAVVMLALALAGIAIRLVLMGCPFVNAELDPLDGLALFALEVHVKVADLQFGELPFKGGGFDAEVAESADSHVAADAGKTIEKEDTHTFETQA